MMQEDSNGDFEIVDKKMATLLASDPSGGSSSVLTNVSPPSALPSFLASPLPAAAPSAPQPSPLPMAPAVSVPYNPADGGNIMRPPSGPPPVQSPGPIPPSSGVPPPPGVRPPPGVPPPSAIPHPSGVPPLSGVHPPSGVPLPSGVRLPSGVPLPSGVRPPSSAFPPTTAVSPSPIPFPPPNSAPPQGVPVPAPGHPSPVSPSHPVASQAPVAPFVPSSGPSLPITTHSQAPPSVVGNVDAASVDLGSPGVVSGRPGWFGWIRGTVSNVSHRVAEKARSSMDTMITTLDPQMKEFIHSGGDMDIVVASDKEVKVGAIRESFQLVFGKATVVGLAAKSESVAMQPVGFEAALRSAEERINSLRSSGQVHPQQPVVSLENFIVEFTPECWYEMGLLLLDDPGEDIILQTYTQVTPVPPDFITQARAATKDDYPFKTTGFAATVGHIASQALQIHHTMWQEVLTGVSRRDTIVLAARTLATLYKSRLPRSI